MMPCPEHSPGQHRHLGSPAFGVTSSPAQSFGSSRGIQSPELAHGRLGSSGFAMPSALSPACGSPGLALSPGTGCHGLAFSPGMAGGPLPVPPQLGSCASMYGQRSIPRMSQAAAPVTIGSLSKDKTDHLLTRLCGKHWHPCVLTRRTAEETECALALSLNWFSDTILDGTAKSDAWINKAVDMYKNSLQSSDGHSLNDKSLAQIVEEGKALIAEHQRRALEQEAARQQRAQAEQQAVEFMARQHMMFNPAAHYQQQQAMQSHFMQNQMLPGNTPVTPLHGHLTNASVPAASVTAALQRAGFPSHGMVEQPPLGADQQALISTSSLPGGRILTPTMPETPVRKQELQILRIHQDATGQVFAEAPALAKKRRLNGRLEDYEIVGTTYVFAKRLDSQISMWDLMRSTDEPWPDEPKPTVPESKTSGKNTAQSPAADPQIEVPADTPEEKEGAEETAGDHHEDPKENEGLEATSVEEDREEEEEKTNEG